MRGGECENYNALWGGCGSFAGAEQLGCQTMFGSGDLYLLEDLGLMGAMDWDWLDTNFDRIEANLLVWQKGSVPAVTKRKFPKGTNFEVFEISKEIFKAVGEVWPGNTDGLEVIRRVVEGEGAEFFLAMLARQLRDLMAVKLDSKALPYPGWRVQKLKRQAEKFSEIQLGQLIEKLAEADVEAKTGGVDLATGLDLVLLQQLQFRSDES